MSACRPHFTIDWNNADVNIGTNGTCTVTGDTFKQDDITVQASFMVNMECVTGWETPPCPIFKECSNVGGDNCAFPQHKVKVWEIRQFAKGATGSGGKWINSRLEECKTKFRYLLQNFSWNFYMARVASCVQEHVAKGIEEGTFDWQLDSWYTWFDYDVRQELNEMHGDCCDCIFPGHRPNARSWGHYDHGEIIDAGGRPRRN